MHDQEGSSSPVNGTVNSFSPSALLEATQDGGSDRFPWRDVETPTSERKLEGNKCTPSEQYIDPTVVQMKVEIKLPVVSLEWTASDSHRKEARGGYASPRIRQENCIRSI